MIDLKQSIIEIAKLLDKGEFVRAKYFLDKSIKIYPKSSKLRMYMGYLAYRNNDFEKAIKFLTSAIKLDNKDSNSFFYRGISYGKINENIKAIIDFERAIKLNNKYSSYYHFYGLTLMREGEFKKALLQIEKAILIDSSNDELILSRGICKNKLGLYEEASKDYKSLINRDKFLYQARFNLSLTLLQLKEFKIGWQLYKSYYKLPNNKPEFSFTKNEWDGVSSGDTILVWKEQGLGDQIMSFIFLDKLKEKFRNIIVLCDNRLINIFRRSFDSVFTFLPSDTNIEKLQYDCHMPCYNLLRLYSKTNLKQNNFTAELKINTIESRKLQQKINNYNNNNNKKKIIGISWFSENPENGKIRSYEAIDFLNAFKKYKENIILVNLQYNSNIKDIDSIAKRIGINLYTDRDIDLYNNIDGLLSLASVCHHIISIDNSTVHLAGASGLNTHIILNRPWDWRWLDGQNIWYKNTYCYPQRSNINKNYYLNMSIDEIMNRVI